MYIKVKRMDGVAIHEIDNISKLTTVAKLKPKIQHIFDLKESTKYKLYYSGKQLIDDHSLFDYGVDHGHIIQIMIIPSFTEVATESADASSVSSGETEPYCNATPVVEDKSSDDKNSSTSQRSRLKEIFKVGDVVEVKHPDSGTWFSGDIEEVSELSEGGLDESSFESGDRSSCDDDAVSGEREMVKRLKYVHMNHVKNDPRLAFKVKLEKSGEHVTAGVKDVRMKCVAKLHVDDIHVGDIVSVSYSLHTGDTRNRFNMCVDDIINTSKRKVVTGTVYDKKSKHLIRMCKVDAGDIFRIEKTYSYLLKAGVVNNNNDGEISSSQREGSSASAVLPDVNSNTIVIDGQTVVLPDEGPDVCPRCKNNAKRVCRECGCKVCGVKKDDELTILCDECDDCYHIYCLDPPLPAVPEGEEEWFCPLCKNDDTIIVKAGEKLKVSKKKAKMASQSGECKRDWGRGMATAGRRKECTIVPAHHFGPIPGVPVGSCWTHQNLAGEAGVHRPPVGGIAGQAATGAQSIVLSNAYEDDVDNGLEFKYTGSGGRDLSGNKRNGEQTKDQALTQFNMSLARNCAAGLSPNGADAGDKWRKGKPLRVVRNAKGRKHSDYAPLVGLRYDGIYKVVKYWQEKGKSGFKVWRYLMRRDDTEPVPWGEEGKKRSQELGIKLEYPEGYDLTQLLPKKKRKRKRDEDDEDDSSESDEDDDEMKEIKSLIKRQKTDKVSEYKMSEELKEFLEADTINVKIWNDLKDQTKLGMQGFMDKVQELFMCIVCQDLAAHPITTPCAHNICRACLKRSFDADVHSCPHCREDLKTMKVEVNNSLSSALLHLFPGYNVGR